MVPNALALPNNAPHYPEGWEMTVDNDSHDDAQDEHFEVQDGAQNETRRHRRVGGIPLRAFVPNAVTALALCCGLSGVRAAMQGDWTMALMLIVGAGVLDGIDGRIARLLKANTRFGAELDSLSDVIAFGVAPATVMYLWSLAAAPKFGWTAALSLTVCCALRLARFNANIDVADQPHKSAGFNTGVPAPAGAGLAFLPLFLWLVTDIPELRMWYVTMPWVVFVAFLMISSVATFNWSALRLRREWRLPAIAAVALIGTALVTAPWQTLIAVTSAYLVSIPFSMGAYRKIKRQRRS
jgi:CDP-diacylglycerol--serine O-phosphatidyltransferase